MNNIVFQTEVPKGFKGEYVNGIFTVYKEEPKLDIKAGDVLCINDYWLCICEEVNDDSIVTSHHYSSSLRFFFIKEKIKHECYNKEIKKATEDQIEEYKQGFIHNGIIHERFNKKWTPAIGEEYWYGKRFFTSACRTINEDTEGDKMIIGLGNCFKTEDECIKYMEYIRKCSLNFK